jgi:hypothetical protein
MNIYIIYIYIYIYSPAHIIIQLGIGYSIHTDLLFLVDD